MNWMIVNSKNIKLDLIMIGFTIFLNGLGRVWSIGDMNLVYFFAFFSLALLMANFAIVPSKRNSLTDYRKLIICFTFIFWILYAAIQGMYVVDYNLYNQGMGQLISNFIIVIFILYLFDFKTIDNLKTLYRAVLMILLINDMLGICELVLGIHFVQVSSVWEADCVRGLSNNVNEYATTMYCAMGIIFIIESCRKLCHKSSKNRFASILLVLSFSCVVGSGSRGIFLGVVMFVLFYLFGFFLFKYFDKSKWLLKLMSIIIMLLVMFYIYVKGMNAIVENLIMNYSGEGDSLSDLYRLHLIQGAIDCFLESNFLGVGPGQSIYYLQMNVHNFFFEILAEYGLMFFALFIMLFAYIWTGAFSHKIRIEMRLLYFSIIPSMVVASVSSSSIFKFKLFWILIVLLVLIRKSNFNDCGRDFDESVFN